MKDWCSYFPDYWFGTYIGDCCHKHDDQYDTQDISKEKSDEGLAKCIFRKVPWYKGNFIVAPIVWIGVRIGGLYSWNECKEILEEESK